MAARHAVTAPCPPRVTPARIAAAGTGAAQPPIDRAMSMTFSNSCAMCGPVGW